MNVKTSYRNLGRMGHYSMKLKSSEEKKISALTQSLEQCADMSASIDVLSQFREENKDVIYNPRNGSYSYKNYYIIPGLKGADSAFEANLRFINRLGHCKTSAPELVSYTASKDNKFGTIIYRLNDTQGGELLPLRTLKAVSKAKKEQFLDEQLALLSDTHLFNRAVVDSYKHWCLTPEGGIYIDSWDNLEKCNSPVEKKEIEAKIRKLL